ncbi:xanthoxin dehydrogenase [Tripterygium wilfordii]|uniref:Xanthoxin dehydrogenase n=1 Tax=Tripterygium wilfordii TaxID=458696 RepID=A0A7J7C6A9_TRIWF|nr:zerumbone synthase-like [Tripterygium wilfordii]KAF5729306.1 xanthoxin dehydrogenase [Tripterygium wilfordii]
MSSSATNSDDLPTQRLLGKVAIVTGGATGIGASIVRTFHKQGAKVCILDLQDDRGQQLCDSLGGDLNACYLHCDVSNEDDIRHAVDFTVEKFGTLDIMVNNAGLSGPVNRDIRDVEISTFDKVVDVNLRGVFIGMKHAARIMIPQKKGAIISIGSLACEVGGMAPHAYTGAKCGVIGLTKNVAAELGKHGIRVNAVSPYAIATDMLVSKYPKEMKVEDILAGFQANTRNHANLQGVDITVEDVANATLFLASDESRYISGSHLIIDGGFTSVNHAFKVFR